MELVRSWEHSDGSSGLAGALAALVALDDAADVDRVVGFVSSMPTLPAVLEQLGIALAPGRHLIVRGSESAEEAVQLRRVLHLLPDDEIEALLRERRVHRETLLLLHEWAHTMGASHDPAEGFILSPRYDLGCAGFSDASRALLRAALAAGDPGAAPRVVPASTPAREPPARPVEPVTPAKPPSRERTVAANLNDVVRLFERTGDAERAWALLAPLAAREPTDARVQHWSCYLAFVRAQSATATQTACEAAAHLPGALPEVHLMLGDLAAAPAAPPRPGGAP
ncbi:hypothetical protein AMYX_24610 [Anaeromyxobacter diazotrophicus]|uniref:Uncharacterized protein n=1 Tax=Anaeromyxobacter diazotrophicus TaxID=2590199 RepID=A0A7I9VNN8_9BACT|nr:hypothetical protein AMYX_24610 [Anaeromyxobacter diazotrophicus]